MLPDWISRLCWCWFWLIIAIIRIRIQVVVGWWQLVLLRHGMDFLEERAVPGDGIAIPFCCHHGAFHIGDGEWFLAVRCCQLVLSHLTTKHIVTWLDVRWYCVSSLIRTDLHFSFCLSVPFTHFFVSTNDC